MRPRPDAAENTGETVKPPLQEAGFNEAAARCRGKHWQSDPRAGARLALQ